MFFKDLKDFNLPKAEEKVLEFWKKNKTFEKSLDKTKKGKRFIFFEGPPTANGRPGIHHVIGRAFKDIIPRYKTMQGYHVPRVAGWDTHGLPVEIEVEKELGLKSKKDIEAYGIAKFNQKCRESVWKYKEEWEKLTARVGFWLDFDNPYITYEKNYIETLWWIVKQVWEKKLLYKGHKVVPWCTRCGTALSSHEIAQGYKEVLDKSVYVKFKIKGKKEYILAWTTTPWTLPGNVALAVGKNIKYVYLKHKNEVLILAKDLVEKVGVEGEVIKEVSGKELAGLVYEPLFNVSGLKSDKAYKVYPADFVTTTDGTGVVHTAVMYGEDDYDLGTKLGLPKHHTVDERGFFTKEVSGLGGQYVKDDETEDKIINHLIAKNYYLKAEVYEHEYPHCWRCDTPLLYYARESWFVAMSKLRPKLIQANKAINWVPGHFKEGRFGEWLREVKDWNFSRERYWGTPIPAWHCKKCDKYEVVGSLEELSKKSFGPRNEYWVMRHGEAESNMLHVTDSGQGKYHLTDKGRAQIKKTMEKLKKAKIDMIIASPVLRAKETEKIDQEILGVKDVSFDNRLREINLGVLTGSPSGTYNKDFPTYESRFEKGPEGGESLRDLRARVWDLFQDLEKKYQGKRILLVSHEYTIWMILQAAEGWTEKEAIQEKERRGDDFVKNAELTQLNLRMLPRDETGEVNLHRPYVDEVKLRCSRCRGEMERIKELCDVWFDSGSMPFAQWHYPFENKEMVEKGRAFPADYIAEAVDQTRGWFYTLLAVSVLLGHKNPYKNVICYGHVLDKHGKKMSKSKGNVVSPWDMAEKYGMDAVRWHFFSGGPPGEPRNFDENDVLKTYRRFHMLLLNSLVFLNTYNSPEAALNKKASLRHVLDAWIVARLNETVLGVTKYLDKLEIREAAVLIEGLVDDLSRWYIRRSRRRFS
ncbi:MAG: class I tRNA ligase family protein, partial [bacterium]|nr:class I tRNA ligase family protein [bacterium]